MTVCTVCNAPLFDDLPRGEAKHGAKSRSRNVRMRDLCHECAAFRHEGERLHLRHRQTHFNVEDP